jgi:tight adherence protein B
MLMGAVCLAVAAACGAYLLLRQALRLGRSGASLLGARTETDLAQLFVFIGARELVVATGLLVVAVVATCMFMQVPHLYLPLVAVVVAFIPRTAVAMLRRQRRRRIAVQLPDALVLWAGLLRSGQGLGQALTQVANRQVSPLGDELHLVLRQHRLGIGLDVAIASFRDRAGVADLRLLATLLHANRELGGNLAESLQRLSGLLRSRLAMEARIQSLTAQGRLQGLVVGALPVLLLFVLYAMEPVAMRVLHTTYQGWVALGVIAVLEIVGFMLIRKIVGIEV